MTLRASIAMTAVFLVLAGCHKSPAPAVTDFRILKMAVIEVIIADKTGSPVALTPAGPNQYTGTRQVPGDTLRVPVTVTVEQNRIVVETRGGGFTSRQVITPLGLEKDDLR